MRNFLVLVCILFFQAPLLASEEQKYPRYKDTPSSSSISEDDSSSDDTYHDTDDEGTNKRKRKRKNTEKKRKCAKKPKIEAKENDEILSLLGISAEEFEQQCRAIEALRGDNGVQEIPPFSFQADFPYEGELAAPEGGPFPDSFLFFDL